MQRDPGRDGLAAARLLNELVPGFLELIHRNQRGFQSLMHECEQELRGEPKDILQYSLTVSKDVQKRAPVWLSPNLNPFPPSVSFGEGEGEVRVSPTVGGSDNPDAFGSAGVQIDFNPSGAGRKPRARLTAGVDFDGEGRVRGASVGWKCEF